jgi:Zn-dependent peptidase ImmA (M78 family)
MRGYRMKSAAPVAALLTFEPEPYYFEMKELARQVREHYALVSPRVRCSELRKTYRAQGIRLTLWPGKVRNVRGAYFNDELGVNVMVMRKLPEDAMAFTMAHELKHHLVDSDLKPYSKWRFDQLNPIELGADLFAAELIYPEKTFESDLARMRTRAGECPLDIILRLKKKTGTTLPYRVFRERAVSMGFAPVSMFRMSLWRKLEKANW